MAVEKPTIQQLFERYGSAKEHAQQVEQYAQKLFDALNKDICSFSQREKEYLKTAAYLHDIGYAVEKKSHHKHTMNLILENGIAGFDEEETKIIAHIARYHRSSLPDETKHKRFASLDENQKQLVKKLGAILRIADGLDKPTKNLILRIEAKETPESIDFYLKTIGFKPKLKMAQEKSDMFETVFNKKVNFYLI